MGDSRIDFFLPGPTWVRDDVLAAMTGPMIGHRSAAFKDLYRSLEPRLRQVFRSEADVMLASGSATLIMESAVESTVDTAVLNLTCGAFSERWHTISQNLGKRADKLEVPWGRPVDPDLVRDALRRKSYEAVTIVHSETSTGVLSPLAEVARVVREESDALILVDTVSSLGGVRVETDAWGLDIVLAGTQKALAAPPGLTVFSLSERAAERAAAVPHRGFYTDLLRYRDKHRAGGTVTTPTLPVVYALDRQLDVILDEGIEARWQRHLDLQSATMEWAGANGLDFASAAGFRSPTISCLRAPASIDPTRLVGQLAERGWVIGGGYGQWRSQTFRIGHMGEVRDRDLQALFATMSDVIGQI